MSSMASEARRTSRVAADQLSCGLEFKTGEFEPEFGGLVHCLKEMLVAVRHLLGRFLQRQQLVGPQIALVVGRGGARQHRLV